MSEYDLRSWFEGGVEDEVEVEVGNPLLDGGDSGVFLEVCG
jgi:hypothetical protein